MRPLPWSHWLTLSSLHAVIGSMLGVLIQSLLHLPAVLADFYLSGLQGEEHTDADLESDDDESFFLPQVQVRVSLLSANGAEMSGWRPLPHPLTPPPAPSNTPPPPLHLTRCWWCLITSFIVPCVMKPKAAQGATCGEREGWGQATPVPGSTSQYLAVLVRNCSLR